MSRQTFVASILAVVVVALIAVASAHRVFAQVIDEPIHIAAGYDYLRTGSYLYDIEHPPLARVLAALPLLETGPPSETDWLRRGNALLTSGRYEANLARARMGNLLFFAVAIVCVAEWARRLRRPSAAISAAILFASLPPVLAHAGVATTDIAGAAMTVASLLSLRMWLEYSTWPRATLLGITIGLGLLSKFSFVPFFLAGSLVILFMASRGRGGRLSSLATVGVAFLIVWGGYRFDFGTLAGVRPNAPEVVRAVVPTAMEETAVRLAREVPIPAPLFLAGILEVRRHDLRGHSAYLFGEKNETGWWYYFPVALLFKTPLPFLALAIAGCIFERRIALMPAIIALAILIVATTASINIGVRHILPAYPFLAIAAGAGAEGLWRQRDAMARVVSVALFAWQLVGTGITYPDYIPWFNEAAREPGRILIDSNLDWGQDVLRLRRFIREQKVTEMTSMIFTNADLDRLGFPRRAEVQADKAPHGWLAISETMLRVARADGVTLPWLEPHSYRLIGKTIRVYYLP